MKKFKCSVCGYVYEGNEPPERCPVCFQPGDMFIELEPEGDGKKGPEKSADSFISPDDAREAEQDLSYDQNFIRHDKSCRYMEEIHEMAVTGKSLDSAMCTQMPMPNWDDILILGAQLNPPPLDDEDEVDTKTVIGKNAKKPMVIDNPVYISHMSFGALSKEIKKAL